MGIKKALISQSLLRTGRDSSFRRTLLSYNLLIFSVDFLVDFKEQFMHFFWIFIQINDDPLKIHHI